MDANNLMAVTTGDAGKVNHAKPRARVDDKNVQNVDFLDIVNRLSASQTQSSGKAGKTSKQTGAQEASGAQELTTGEVDSTKTDNEVLGTLDEIISEYGAENLNADILMELMSMYTTDSSVEGLVNSDDPLQTVQSSLYSAVLDNTSLLRTGGEMIDEIADGYFDDLVNVMGSSKALNSLLEALGSVQDADEFERALKTISGITVTSEVNEVDRTVNVLSEQLNLSKAVRSAQASIEGREMPVQTDAAANEAPIFAQNIVNTQVQPAQQIQPEQTVQSEQLVQTVQTVQTAAPESIAENTGYAQPVYAEQREMTAQPEQTAQTVQTAFPETVAENTGYAQPEYAQTRETSVQPEQTAQTTPQPVQTEQALQQVTDAQTAQPQQVMQTAQPESDEGNAGYAQPMQTERTDDASQTYRQAPTAQQPTTEQSHAPGKAQTAQQERSSAPVRTQSTRSTQQTQPAQVSDAPTDTAAQAMGFVDYGRGVTPKEVLTEGTPEDKAVFNQTLDLLSRAITEERQLYTARLHPEGLGEIIRRMEKSSAGVVFDILATNEKTAQLINARLAQLQNGMSEYEAKVNPAVVTASSNAESMSGFGFDDFSGSFGGRGENAYSGNRQRAGTRYTEVGEDEREAKTTGYKTTDILNRTI